MRKFLLLLISLSLTANFLQATPIFIKTPDGQVLNLDEPASNSIQQLTYTIQVATGFPMENQLIGYNGSILNNGNTLQDYSIPANSYLQLIITASPNPTTDNVLYVNQQVPTSSDQSGSSWDNAITDLSSALLWVRQQQDAGTATWTSTKPLKIYIAQGTYYPVYNANDDHVTESGLNLSAFVLTSNVQLMGGFPSTGNPDINSRNWTTFPTILSGDPLTPGDNTDNAGHVVITVGTGDSSMLSGLTITAGRSNNSTMLVGGQYINPYIGAGMVCINAAPTIENVIFKDNQATGANGPSPTSGPVSGINGYGGYPAYGGGMYNANASPTLINVSFISNLAIGGAGSDGLNGENGENGSAGVNDGNGSNGGNGGNGGPGSDAHGGGLYNNTSSPTLMGVVFYDNKAIAGNSGQGGNGGSGGNALLITPNSTGGSGGNGGNSGNAGLGSGAGMYSTGTGIVNIINCTFSKNQSVGGTAGNIGLPGQGGSGNISGNNGLPGFSGSNGQSIGGALVDFTGSNIQNSILFGNIADVFSEAAGINTTTFSYCYINGNGTWQMSLGADGGHNIISTQNPFTDNSSGDLTLVSGSQAINNGNNAAVASSFTVDQLNHLRINNGSVDMGAYESGNYTVPVGLQYFNAVRMPNKIHLSWATASESQNAGFTIARSINGINYRQLTSIKGSGNSTNTSEYGWDDLQPENGINYYQLQQVDINGQIKNLGVRTVNYSKFGNAVALYPNPAKEKVHITLDTASMIRVYDPTGRKVLELKGQHGDNILQISNLPSGVYFIELDNGKDRLKFIKK